MQLIDEALNFKGKTVTMAGYPLPVTINSYFLSTASNLIAQAYKDIEKLVASYTGYSFLITGHSLGGAMAQVVAFDLVGAKYIKNPFVYTFGSPRVGDINFVKQYSSAIKQDFRVIFNRDLIPHVPPNNVITYLLHTPNEIWYGGLDLDVNIPCLYAECLSDPVSLVENANCGNKFSTHSIDEHSIYGLVAAMGQFCMPKMD